MLNRIHLYAGKNDIIISPGYKRLGPYYNYNKTAFICERRDYRKIGESCITAAYELERSPVYTREQLASIVVTP